MNQKVIKRILDHVAAAPRGQYYKTLILEGESGIGKTTLVQNSIRQFLSNEYKAETGETPSEAQLQNLWDQRVLWIPMGGSEESEIFLGITAPSKDGESVVHLRPKSLSKLRENPKRTFIVLDELNRASSFVQNAVQTILEPKDRFRTYGLSNTVVFGTQNPSDGEQYINTSESDKALESRVNILQLDPPTERDVYMYSEMLGWHPSISEGIEYILEEDPSNVKSLDIRALVDVNEYLNAGFLSLEVIEANVKDTGRATAIVQAYESKLFKSFSLEELEGFSVQDFTEISVVALVHSFRRIISSSRGDISTIKRLGKVALRTTATQFASIHTRFGKDQACIIAWATVPGFVQKAKEIKG